MPRGHQPLEPGAAQLDHSHERIEVNRVYEPLEWRRLPVVRVVSFRESVQLASKPAHVRLKAVPSPRDVLAEVDAAGPHMRNERLERGDLVVRRMAPVVDHDVDE